MSIKQGLTTAYNLKSGWLDEFKKKKKKKNDNIKHENRKFDEIYFYNPFIMRSVVLTILL